MLASGWSPYCLCEGMPVQRQSSGVGAPPLERAVECAALAEAVERAVAGLGALVVIEASAGLGKTRLLESAGELAAAAGAQMLGARGDELESGLPWGVVRQLFDRRVGAAPPAERDQLLSGAAGLAAPLFGWERPGEVRGGPLSALLHGLYWLTVAMAERQALVLAVDDVHLADVPSLRYLAYVARRVEDLPVALLVTLRSGERGPGEQLIRAVTSEPSAIRLAPKPLSERAVGELIERFLEDTADLEFCRACHSVTGGNPFLLDELLRTLAEEGLAPDVASAARLRSLIPQGVSRAVFARLARLPQDAASLAVAVALLGRDAELRRAAALAELDERSAARAADALVAAGILRPTRPLEFVHPLVREAVHGDLPPLQRALGHARAARMLAREDADEEQIAMHLLASEPVAESWALERLRAAAGQAAARGAPESAVAYLRRALEEPVPTSVRGELLLELGVLESTIGDEVALERLAAAQAQLHRLPQRARAALAFARLARVRDRWRDAAAALRAALDEIGEQDGELALELEMEMVAVSQQDPQADAVEQRGRLERVAAARDTPAARLALACLAQQAVLESRPVAEARALAEAALAGGQLLAETTADHPHWTFAVDALIAAACYDAAAGVCRDALQDARRRGSTSGFLTASVESAAVALFEGNLREGDMHAQAAIDADVDEHLWKAVGVGLSCWAAVEMGELQAAEELLQREGLAGPLEVGTLTPMLLAWRAPLRLAQGRADEAISDLRRGGELLAQFRLDTPLLFPWRHHLAAALGADARAEARDLAEEDLELARRAGAPRALGIALRTAGLIEGGDRGLTLLTDAANLLEGSGARLEYARALIDLGAALRRANRRRDARKPLLQGLDGAHRCGALPLVRRAQAELAALGARPRRLVLTGVEALTASELRVAQMAAERQTNREIAQALFVTQKTVETHLRVAYQKLGIASRQQLAEALGTSKIPPQNDQGQST